MKRATLESLATGSPVVVQTNAFGGTGAKRIVFRQGRFLRLSKDRTRAVVEVDLTDGNGATQRLVTLSRVHDPVQFKTNGAMR